MEHFNFAHFEWGSFFQAFFIFVGSYFGTKHGQK